MTLYTALQVSLYAPTLLRRAFDMASILISTRRRAHCWLRISLHLTFKLRSYQCSIVSLQNLTFMRTHHYRLHKKHSLNSTTFSTTSFLDPHPHLLKNNPIPLSVRPEGTHLQPLHQNQRLMATSLVSASTPPLLRDTSWSQTSWPGAI